MQTSKNPDVDPSGGHALPGHITRLARRLQYGDGEASEELLGLVYQRLRSIAAGIFAERSGNPTLQPTLLVHDAFLKMRGKTGRLDDREHFYALAALAMRQVLRDYGRVRSAQKRGGEWVRVSLSEAVELPEDEPLELHELNAALDKLGRMSPRQAQIVELRFLAGLKIEEVASVLGFSVTLVGNEWRVARAFLRRELGEQA